MSEEISKKLEFRKRRREIFISLFVGVVFLILTWVEFQLVAVSKELPFVHSIFFFGLVNVNVILVLFLMFLIFRNIVKVFVERRGRIIGSSLRGKLVAAFAAFSFVPTLLMFLISVFYINNSFEKWFSSKVKGVLRDSLDVTNNYVSEEKKRNYHFAHEISRSIANKSSRQKSKLIEQYVQRYKLDSVEYYPGLFGDRIMAISRDQKIGEVPRASLEFLQKGLDRQAEASTIHQFSNGNLNRVIVPVDRNGSVDGALVVSSFTPLSLITRIDEIADAYEDFRNINPLEYPVKSIYLIILALMTLVIFFAATWLGFHLAKQLSTPLRMLGEGLKEVAKGSYRNVTIETGSEEIHNLISNFNQMTSDLERSEKEVLEANRNLKMTLSTLDEHSRYIEAVLSSVSAGVVSVDSEGIITTINKRAGKLLRIEPEQYINSPMTKVLPSKYLDTYETTIGTLHEYNVDNITREIRLNIDGDPLLMQMTINLLRDVKGKNLGVVIVFDDLTMLINAQRAAAWREVARRIAHEIKNPLTPIKLSAQRLEKKFGSDIQDPAFQACTSTIIKQVDELKSLVNEFSQFARLPQAKPKMSSLNSTVGETAILYQTGHGETKIDFNADENLPEFNFDPEQIRRVISNLLENSVAAVKSVEHPLILIETKFDEQLGIARLSITDNGSGIPEDLRGRIFEPYVTTKSSGTGLGLSIVKRIVEEHHGFVRAYEAESGGTRLVVELPVADGPVADVENTQMESDGFDHLIEDPEDKA